MLAIPCEARYVAVLLEMTVAERLATQGSDTIRGIANMRLRELRAGVGLWATSAGRAMTRKPQVSNARIIHGARNSMRKMGREGRLWCWRSVV